MTLRTYPEGSPHPGPIGRVAAESEPAWPVAPAPPPGAPNVLVVLFDDLGFAQLGCFGGLGGRIRTPHIDCLAAEGLRYQNFHTTALCSPSRAALLTGRNHHSVGVATIMERATGFPGYNGRIPKDAAMLPAVLRANGYATMALGKWHLAPDEHISPAGPFDRFPLGQGFERFYGFLGGETSQWEPDLWADNHRVQAPHRPKDGYHLSEDLVEHAIEWINTLKAVAPTKPFFTYLAFGATHSPHHVPQEYVEPYRGAFDDGWDEIRRQTLEHQIETGLVPAGTTLPDLNPGVRAWSELTDDERRLYARQMEVYAGMVTHTDAQIGRLIDFLDRSGLRDDTLVMVLSDNGASAEGAADGRLDSFGYINGAPDSVETMLEHLDEWGSPSTHPHYASGWAMAGNTPNRMYKSFVHEGGTRDPLIVSWPARIGDEGAIRTQFHHIIDLVPTVLEAIGLEWPGTVHGHPQRPVEGTSLMYTFTDVGAPTRKRTQYFEMFAHRAMWADGWKAVTLHWSQAILARLGHIDHELHDGDFDADTWELYHLDQDVSEMRDLAAEHPEKLRELVDLWWAEAERYQVLPLDDSLVARLFAERPRVFEARDVYSYTGRVRLTRQASPILRDCSYTISADVDVPDSAEGVIVSYGGVDGGLSLCVIDGRLHYVSNFLGRAHTVATSADPLPAGPHTIDVLFDRTAPNAGDVRLYLDGKLQATASVPRLNAIAFSSSEGLEVGSDTVSPVWPRYHSPFEFTGTIRRVVVTTPKGDAPLTPEMAHGERRMAESQQ
jgi:arylsulfatase A-like enzyme